MFQLEGGGYTRILFFKDEEGVIHPFPSDNVDIVRDQGSKESKEMLNKILKVNPSKNVEEHPLIKFKR